jgi:hypothetical protein
MQQNRDFVAFRGDVTDLNLKPIASRSVKAHMGVIIRHGTSFSDLKKFARSSMREPLPNNR